MAVSPTQRSIQYLKDCGYLVEVVEKWNPYARVRNDLFGFIDILAVHPDKKETVGVQTTSTPNLTKRKQKVLESRKAYDWLRAGNRIVLQGWKKYAKPVDRKYWRITEIEITLNDF